MAATRSFTPAYFRFLRDLADNNDRDWFAANKERYERDVREPGLEFIAEFAPHLRKISPNFVADPRPVGGSMFRIHRDVRFSKDKSPYKTYTGYQFRHEAGKDVHAPGFYLHMAPRNVYVGIGIWRPESPTLKKVREAIVADPAAWKRAAYGKRFTDVFQLEGDALKRPPKGFDTEHPFIDDLKRKDFIGGTRLTQTVATSPGFPEAVARVCRTGNPLMRFLCEAVGVPF